MLSSGEQSFTDKLQGKSNLTGTQTFSTQPKLSESGVEVNSNNFEGLDFGEEAQIATILPQPIVSEQGVEVNVKDFGLDSLFENNQQNIRNSKESFVPLSKIEGTMRNIKLKETQNEVFKEVTSVPSATEMRLLNKAAVIRNLRIYS